MAACSLSNWVGSSEEMRSCKSPEMNQSPRHFLTNQCSRWLVAFALTQGSFCLTKNMISGYSERLITSCCCQVLAHRV